MDFSDTTKIRELNDQFRATGQGGQIYITAGIAELDELSRSIIMQRVQDFTDFTEDNDPYQEHDFGAFDFKGKKIFWKIDYYDFTMQHGSENPACIKETSRLLTIMFASEY